MIAIAYKLYFLVFVCYQKTSGSCETVTWVIKIVVTLKPKGFKKKPTILKQLKSAGTSFENQVFILLQEIWQ